MTHPLLTYNPEVQPFWDAARKGRLMLRCCEDCGKPHWFPRDFCPCCWSNNVKWTDSEGTGTIYSWTVMRRPENAMFALGYVDLDEGVRVYVKFRACDHDRLAIGRRVTLGFEDDPAAAAGCVLVAALQDETAACD